MKYLFDDWKNIRSLIETSAQVLLALDYDGTLTPIVKRPQDAILDNHTRQILASLSKKGKFSVAIISGRKLKEVQELVKIKDIYFAGNHGFEIKGPNVEFIHPVYFYFKPYIEEIKKAFLEKTKDINGVLIEDKGITLSLHYRLVDEKNIKRVKDIFEKACLPYLKRGKIRIISGKKVLEIRPPIVWDKGKALKTIEDITKKSNNTLTIYIGDDKTDEDVFSAIKNKGISIFAGQPKNSGAKYFLNNTFEVKKFLERLKGL